MRIQTQSMIDADTLRTNTLVALAQSGTARQNYIDGLRRRVSDDELRHLHTDAMHMSAAADKAAGAQMGIRHVEYAE